MADIFISYAKEDRDRVKPLAEALEDQGWSVFWAREIPPGKTWDEIIEDAIEAAKCIIVVWTETSVTSGWVRAEAQEGLNREILVPVKFEDVKIPLRFRPVQAANLIGWEENTSDSDFKNLHHVINNILRTPPEEKEKRIREQAEREVKQQRRRKQEEEEAKQKAREKRKRKEKDAKIKPDKPEVDATLPSEPHKKKNARIFGAVAGVIVLIIIGIGWWIPQQKETRPIAALKSRIFVSSAPDNATVKILNIDETFQQGMELKPGKYHFEVSSEGYEPQDTWIELGPGEEKRINFNLKEIIQKVARQEQSRAQELATQPQSIQSKSQTTKEQAAQVQKEVETRPGHVFRDKLKDGSEGPEMVILAAGNFLMGTPETDYYFTIVESPQHSVTISQPFAISINEITFTEYDAFAKATGRALPPDDHWGRGDRPAIHVDWYDARAFADWLSVQTGQNYRLPTEAEWEYAARAESTTAFSFGDDRFRLSDYAWFESNSGGKTHPVGQKKPNSWGVYGMHGNVRELVEDDWHADYDGAPSDGSAWNEEPRYPYRVMRGGSHGSIAQICRLAHRQAVSPIRRNNYTGFRLVRSVDIDS